MFRDDAQRGEVCYLLCRWIPKSPWARRGDRNTYCPSQLAHAGRLPDGVSSGEAAMIRFSIKLWKSEDPVVWLGFDGQRMKDIGELLPALSSPVAIDAWILKRRETDTDAIEQEIADLRALGDREWDKGNKPMATHYHDAARKLREKHPRKT